MKFFTAIVSTLITLAAAARVDVSKRDSSVNVQIEMIGNTMIKASITNEGDEALKVLRDGSILDDAPVEKVSVFSGDKKIPFEGIIFSIMTEGLDDDSFEIIEAGQTVEVEFDAAELHDLSAGGTFSIVAQGYLETADVDGGHDLTGVIHYQSNTVEAVVAGDEAAVVQRSFGQKMKRSILTQCSGSRLTSMRNGMSRCQSLAVGAQRVAQSGSAAKMREFFKSSSSSTRNTVANVFSRISRECSSTNSGVARYYCGDVYGICTRGSIIAYTVPSQSIMANCDLFYRLPATTSRCYAQNQASTVLHEVTHLRQIKGTDDYGAYGYNAVRSLSAAQNLNHADTYTLFAQSIANGC